MKLIERFFGKKEVVPLQITLEFRELPQWIEAQSEQLFGPLSSHISQKYAQINAVLEDIGSSRDQLINAKFGDKVYKRMIKAGASNRDNLVKNLNIIIERVLIPEDTTPSSASEFYINTKSTLNTCLENAIRSQQYVKALFPEEYKLVLADLKQLDTLLDELIIPINENRDKLDTYTRLPGEIEIINQTREQIEEKKKSIQNLEQKYSSLNNDLNAEEATLEELKTSKEFIKAQEVEKQVKTFEDRVSDIDSRIKEMFAPLSKALYRMEKQDESGRYTLSSQNRSILKMLIEDPVSAIDIDITPFLHELKTRVEDGSLGLKQQKMNKTLEQIDRLVDSDILSSLKNQRDLYLSQRDRLLKELEGLTVYKEKNRREKQISDCRSMIDSMEQNLETQRKELARLEEAIEHLKGELNSHFGYVFEKDIKIIY